MANGKKIREKGKLKFSEYFKQVNENDIVALKVDEGVNCSFPRRYQGRSGKVVGERGKFKIVQIKDGRKEKNFIVHPIHLKKLNSIKAADGN